MTLVSQAPGPLDTGTSQMSHFALMAAFVTGCYIALQISYWTLVHDFGTRTFVLGVEYQFVAGGGPSQQRTRG